MTVKIWDEDTESWVVALPVLHANFNGWTVRQIVNNTVYLVR